MPLILGTNSIKDTGYNVSNSVRMSGATVNLQKDFSGDGNRRTWTYSTWFKLSNITQSGFFNWGKGNPEFSLRFESATSNTANNYFRVSQYDGSQDLDLVTSQFFADPSAWGHMVVACDTTQGTASNRIKVYFNGTQITSFSTESYPSQNFDTFVNQASKKHYIGYADYQPINGYLCETVFIDGTQLDPTSFGEFDEDSPTIWKPKDVSGLTFGTNGYYLQYKEAGTSQNASGIGADTSGNNNHFACDDVVATDQATDTCTNNFATFNGALGYNSTIALAEGNLKGTTGSTHEALTQSLFSSIGVTQGKWYAEFKVTTNSNHSLVGISADMESDADGSSGSAYSFIYLGQGLGYYGSNGKIFHTNSDTQMTYGSAVSNNDIVGVALDVDNQEVYFSINGTFQNSGNPASGSSKTGGVVNEGARNIFSTGTGTLFFVVADHDRDATCAIEANFGGGSVSAISSGNSDANGFGNFEYSVPSGYFSLCSSNLAEFG